MWSSKSQLNATRTVFSSGNISLLITTNSKPLKQRQKQQFLMCAIWGEVDTFPCIPSGHASHRQV